MKLLLEMYNLTIFIDFDGWFRRRLWAIVILAIGGCDSWRGNLGGGVVFKLEIEWFIRELDHIGRVIELTFAIL